MRRSALPFLAASMVRSRMRFIYRNPSYRIPYVALDDPGSKRVGSSNARREGTSCLPAAARKREGGSGGQPLSGGHYLTGANTAVRSRTPTLRAGTYSSPNCSNRACFCGHAACCSRRHEVRSAFCVARTVEKSDHHARRGAGAGARHRRDDDDVRVAECGGAAPAAVSRTPNGWSSCGATCNARSVERRGMSMPDYIDSKDKSRSFELMGAWDNATFIRYGGTAPEQVNAEIVAGDYFTILGVIGPRRPRADEQRRPGGLAARRGDRRTPVGARFRPQSRRHRQDDAARQFRLHDRRRRAGLVQGPIGHQRGVGVDDRLPTQCQAESRQPRLPRASRRSVPASMSRRRRPT